MRSRNVRTVTTVESESEDASFATDEKVLVFEYAGSKLDLSERINDFGG
jgi:hypothetical protein